MGQIKGILEVCQVSSKGEDTRCAITFLPVSQNKNDGKIQISQREIAKAKAYMIFRDLANEEVVVMRDRTNERKASDDYLKTLEAVKKQYQQYVEISGLYTLPIQREEKPIQYQPPSLKHPLTKNKIRIMQNEVNVLAR